MRLMCQHCNVKFSNRPRQLCFKCYYTPGVRDLYPTIGIYSRRGVLDFFGEANKPEPTETLPGSDEKLEVLIQRARLKQELWHADDRKH